MKKYLKDNFKLVIFKLLIVMSVLVLDLVTKIVFANIFNARYNGGDYDNIVFIKNILSFTYVENIGAAFSMFSGNTVFLIIFSIVFIGVFIAIDIMYKEKSWWFITGYSLILGGAIGNLIDRLFLGYVRDFISFDFLKDFAICNIADVCITIGCVLLVVYFIILIVKNDADKKKVINKTEDVKNATTDEKDNNNDTRYEDREVIAKEEECND